MAIRDVFECVVLLAASLAVAQGQRLVVLPGAGSTASTASAYAIDPFASAGTVNVGQGAFLAFSNPAGSRFFIVTTSGVVVVDSSGAQVQAPLTIAQPVTGAALSPDGLKLIVVAGDSSSGTASIFDVSSDTASLAASLTVGNHPLDVAVSIDSATAYIIDPTGLTPVDLTAKTAGTTVSLSGMAAVGSAKPGVVVGPNGLVYVSANNAVYEIHPATYAVLNTISVAGFPGKLSFSSDGTAAVTVNQQWGTTLATVLNLVNRTVTSTLGGGLTLQLDRAFFVSSSLIYATSRSTSYLYSFSPAGPNSTWTPVLGSIVTAATSDEATGSKYLFAVGPAGVTRLKLSVTPPTSVAVPLTTPAGAASYLAPANIGNPYNAITYSATQTVAPGGVSVPLVVKLVDSSGRALSDETVTWRTPAGVTLRSAMTTTNAQGAAAAIVGVPTTTGTYTVTANFRGMLATSATFSLTVGTPGGGGSGGGGSGGGAGGISIVSGNGQAVKSSTTSPEPLIVAVADTSGKAAPGAPVTFTISGGGGFLTASVGQNCKYTSSTAVVCNTDASGLAGVSFMAPTVAPSFTTYVQSTVTASTTAATGRPAGSVGFVVTSFPTLTDSGALLPTVQTVAPAGSVDITGQAGQTLKGALQVLVRGLLSVQPIPYIGLSVRSTLDAQVGGLSPATCVGTGGTVLTDASGIASCDLLLGSEPGTYTLYRVVGGYNIALYTLKITPAPAPTPVPTAIQITGGDAQSGAVGQPLPKSLVAVVKDQFGKVMANTTATWTVLSGSATVASASTKTDALGQTSNKVTLGATPGAGQIKIAAGSATAIFKFTSTIAITSITKVSGDAQTAVVSTGFAAPLTVQVNTAQGAAASFPVGFTATGGATLSAASVNTNAQGQASVTVTAGANAGPVQVTATAGGQSVTFNLTARLPGPELTLASFVNGASFQPGFAFGSIVTIKAKGLTTGLDLTPGTCFSDGSLDGLPMTGGLPTRLGGVEIQFGSILAPIFAVCLNADGSEQANVQAPFELAPAKIGVTIRYGAGTSSKTEFFIGDVPVLNAAPGIFEYMADASTRVAVATKPDGSVISPSNPAHPGDTVQVYTTGLGPVLPHVETNKPGVPGQVPFFMPAATLGGTPMGGVTAEYAGNMIGVFVVTFQIPSSQATGTSVPLTIGVVKDDKTTATSQTSQIAISQ